MARGVGSPQTGPPYERCVGGELEGREVGSTRAQTANTALQNDALSSGAYPLLP